MNKFAVLAASLVASFALAFAVYSAESNPNTSGFPRVVASVRLTDLTQPIPPTPIFNVSTTGLYRISSYMAQAAPGIGSAFWSLNLGWTDEVGVENSILAAIYAKQTPPNDFSIVFGSTNSIQPPVPIEAIAGTSIVYYVESAIHQDGGTYNLFITVEQLQ